MTMQRFRMRLTLLAVVLLAALPFVAYAGAPAPTNVTMNIFTNVVDEQNLNLFHNTTGSCSGSPPVIDLANFTGDLSNGPASAYDFGAPWTAVSGLSSAEYVAGTYCNSSTGVCLGVKFNHNEKTLSLDTRGTQGPRTVALNFAPCTSCSIPGSSTPFGNSVTYPVSTTGLLSVFLDNPFTSMSVCSSATCAEAQSGFAKFWFNDPAGDPNLTYRIDWPIVRVLRMSQTTWYVVGNGCDGFQVGNLMRLHNNRRKVTTSFQGSYLFPFFISAER